MGALPRLTRRAFDDLAVWMMAFGLAVGLAFPPFSMMLGVPGPVAFRASFLGSCLGAGVLVAAVNFLLARAVVGTRVRQVAAGMATVREHLNSALDSGDFSGCDPQSCKLPVDSNDELGTVAESFNRLIDAVARTHAVEQAIAGASTAIARELDAAQIAAATLTAVLASTPARGGAVLASVEGSLEVLAEQGLGLDPASLPLCCSTLENGTLVHPGLLDVVRPLSVIALSCGQVCVGALVLDLGDDTPPGLHRLLAVLADTLAVGLANAALHARMRSQACIDDLTKLSNRRTGLARLSEELDRVAVTGEPVGVLLIDVDHFKGVNDTYGHQVGDDALRHIARVIEAEIRPSDLTCRYGGEEFLVVVPAVDREALGHLAERLRQSVERTPLIHPDATVVATISIGAADSATAGTRLETLVGRADEALYAAKRSGRNRTQVAGAAVPAATAIG